MNQHKMIDNILSIGGIAIPYRVGNIVEYKCSNNLLYGKIESIEGRFRWSAGEPPKSDILVRINGNLIGIDAIARVLSDA